LGTAAALRRQTARAIHASSLTLAVVSTAHRFSTSESTSQHSSLSGETTRGWGKASAGSDRLLCSLMSLAPLLSTHVVTLLHRISEPGPGPEPERARWRRYSWSGCAGVDHRRPYYEFPNGPYHCPQNRSLSCSGYVDGAKWMAPKDWDPQGAMSIDFGGDQKPIDKTCKEVRHFDDEPAAAAAAAAADAFARPY
jgi:hypothetical protein